MSPREELLIAIVVALLIGYKLGEKNRRAVIAAVPADPMAWLYSYAGST